MKNTEMNTSKIFNEKDGSIFEQCLNDTILRSALRAGIGLSYECNSGGCGGCKFELLDGEIEILWNDAPGLTDRDRRKNRYLACQCKANGSISIKAATADEYKPAILPDRMSAKLIEKNQITHDICEFIFKTAGRAEFLPGQFAMLDLPGIEGSRAYSLSNISNDNNEWHFQIRRVQHGKGTHYLFDKLSENDEVSIDGPYGVAYLRDDSPRDIVCIAGGSGLAPMVSIARGAERAGLLKDRNLYFFYGARTTRDVCGEDMLRELDNYENKIHYIPVVSLPSLEEDWHGETGYVHEIIARKLSKNLKDYEFYFAGPPMMTQALQELLMVGHQVPFDQIHFDRFF
jgi:toluene monooxygenase electron transfer component